MTPTFRRHFLKREKEAEVTPRSVSCAEIYRRMSKSTCPINKIWFEPAETPLMWGDVELFEDAEASCTGSELNSVQPYWTQVINTRLPQSGVKFEVELVDTHGETSLGNLKPDTMGYFAKRKHNLFHVAVIGENKGRRDKPEFVDKEKGQLLNYLNVFLDMQPHRMYIIGFLSDGFYIQFFRVDNIDNNRSCKETECLQLDGDGGLYLAGLLTSAPDTWADYPGQTVDGKVVDINAFLGAGASAYAFSGVFNGKEVVVKLFMSHAKTRLRNECICLELLQRTKVLDGLVTSLEAETDSRSALLLYPVGQDFRVTADNVCQVIDILFKVHSQVNPWVHRDLRFCNIFLHPETQKVFINDWGCAAMADRKTTYAGAWKEAPNRVLDMVAKQETNQTKTTRFMYRPQVEDDLEMLVKVLFCTMWPDSLPDVTDERGDIVPNPETAEKLLDFWQQQLSTGWWATLMEFVHVKNYKGLADAIVAVLPKLENIL